LRKVDFRLIAISDDIRKPGASETEIVEEAIELTEVYAYLGIRAFQLRKKSWSDRAILRAANAISREAIEYDLTLLINDRPDIAQLARTEGLHLPEHGFPVADARKIYSRGLIGKSCHSIAAGILAKKARADYVMFGPIYETESKKPFGPPLGIDMLRELCEEVRLPVFAVGGITPKRAEECRAAGAHGVAVISALTAMDDFDGTLKGFELALGGL
jgi:thiamine-phosphate pyrophosphorylase